jgi:hypothetical protein
VDLAVKPHQKAYIPVNQSIFSEVEKEMENKIKVVKGKTFPLLFVLPDRFALDYVRVKYTSIKIGNDINYTREDVKIIDRIIDQSEITELLTTFELPFSVKVVKTISNSELSESLIHFIKESLNNLYKVKKIYDFSTLSKGLRPDRSVLRKFDFDKYIAFLKNFDDKSEVYKLLVVENAGTLTEDDFDSFVIELENIEKKEIGKNVYMINLREVCDDDYSKCELKFDTDVMKYCNTTFKISGCETLKISDDVALFGSFYYKTIKTNKAEITVVIPLGDFYLNNEKLNGIRGEYYDLKYVFVKFNE